MHRSLLVVVGLVCLMLCPILIIVLSTSVLDLLGVGVGCSGWHC